MSVPAQGAVQYFLGIGGVQSGPYSRDQVMELIRSGEVPPDTLIWFDGLSEWQPIVSIDFFKDAFPGEQTASVDSNFEGSGLFAKPTAKPSASVSPFRLLEQESIEDEALDADEEPAEIPVPRKPIKMARTPSRPHARRPKPTVPITFSEPGAPPRPVFDVAASGGSARRSKVFAVWTAVLMAGLVVITLVVFKDDFLPSQKPAGVPAELQPKPFNIKTRAKPANRVTAVKSASDKILVSPDTSLKDLIQLAVENPADEPGKEAIRVATEHLRRTKRNEEAGRFLVSVKRFEEAARFFLMEPPSYPEADAALISAYESPEGHKEDVITQDILLLLGPLDNQAQAVERIRRLEADFPEAQHPFQFYLKTTDQKIVDIFQRISGLFVNNLMNYLRTEFQQLGIPGRPLVEIRREKGDKYRIVGRYKGEVVLNQSRLKNIYFVFWLVQDNWYLVDTNLTAERSKFAKAEKARREQDVLTAEKLLSYLQTVFRAQFPKNLLHERVDTKSLAPQDSRW